jgi:hypothetical protein
MRRLGIGRLGMGKLGSKKGLPSYRRWRTARISSQLTASLLRLCQLCVAILLVQMDLLHNKEHSQVRPCGEEPLSG